jgi:hypothetical protein
LGWTFYVFRNLSISRIQGNGFVILYIQGVWDIEFWAKYFIENLVKNDFLKPKYIIIFNTLKTFWIKENIDSHINMRLGF